MICNMKCSINKKYYFLLLILFFAGGLPAKSFNLDKTKPEDIIRLASYNIRTKGDTGIIKENIVPFTIKKIALRC